MGVQFEENDNVSRTYENEKVPKLSAWLISNGLASDTKSAVRIQVIAAIVFFAVAVYFAFK